MISSPTDHLYGERQHDCRDLGGYVWTCLQTIADVAPFGALVGKASTAPDGSISAATFAVDPAGQAKTLAIELLNENGIGVFARR